MASFARQAGIFLLILSALAGVITLVIYLTSVACPFGLSCDETQPQSQETETPVAPAPSPSLAGFAPAPAPSPVSPAPSPKAPSPVSPAPSPKAPSPISPPIIYPGGACPPYTSTGGSVVPCSFSASAGQTVQIGTTNVPGSSFTGDTRLDIFSSSGQLVGYNDDWGSGLGSYISFVAPSTDTYTINQTCFTGFVGVGGTNTDCGGTTAVRFLPTPSPNAPLPVSPAPAPSCVSPWQSLTGTACSSIKFKLSQDVSGTTNYFVFTAPTRFSSTNSTFEYKYDYNPNTKIIGYYSPDGTLNQYLADNGSSVLFGLVSPNQAAARWNITKRADNRYIITSEYTGNILSSIYPNLTSSTRSGQTDTTWTLVFDAPLAPAPAPVPYLVSPTPSPSLAGFAPAPTPSPSLAGFAPAPTPSPSLAGFAPAPTPSPSLAGFAPAPTPTITCANAPWEGASGGTCVVRRFKLTQISGGTTRYLTNASTPNVVECTSVDNGSYFTFNKITGKFQLYSSTGSLLGYLSGHTGYWSGTGFLYYTTQTTDWNSGWQVRAKDSQNYVIVSQAEGLPLSSIAPYLSFDYLYPGLNNLANAGPEILWTPIFLN